MTVHSHPDLVVESGLHRSARCAIPEGATSVGNSSDAAIVLSDLEDGFSIDRSARSMLLRASKTPIEVVGQETIEPGHHRRCGATTHFSCGGIDFKIVVPLEAIARKRWSDIATPAFSFGCGVLLAAVTSAVVLSRAAPVSQPAKTLVAMASATSDGDATRSSGNGAALASVLRRRLDTTGLTSVATSVQGDGSIEASGEIAPRDEVAWHAVEHWFDTVARGRVVLVDSVRVAAIAPPLSVRAVWAGQNPYVVDANGERLFVGSVLSTGWKIQAIDTRQVIMKRGTQTIAVTF